MTLPSNESLATAGLDAAVDQSRWQSCSFTGNKAAAGGAVHVVGAEEGTQGSGMALHIHRQQRC